MKILKLCKSYIYKYKLSILSIFMFNILNWSMSLISPFISGKFIDSLIIEKSIYRLKWFALIIASIYILHIIVSFIESILSAKLSSSMCFDLTQDIISHIKRVSILKLNTKNPAYLTQRINADSDALINFILNNFISIITKGISLLISIGILISINKTILNLLIIFLPMYAIAYASLKKKIFSTTYELRETTNKFFSKVYNQISKIKKIKIDGDFITSEKELSLDFKEFFNKYMDNCKIRTIFSKIDLSITYAIKLALFSVCGIWVIESKITVGEFTIINSYFSMIMSSVNYFFNFGKSYQEVITSYQRIEDLLSLEAEQNGSIIINEIKNINITNLNFSYDNNNNILTDLTFEFKKGNIYGLQGSNGKGKSTFINLLIGLFINEYSGDIKYNGINIRDLDMYFLRKENIRVTQQEPQLLDKSILENISPDNSSENNLINIYNLINQLNLEKFIDKLPNGINSYISELDSSISGGEKQKIALIRTLIKRSDLIILDEPTSALDIKSIANLKGLLKEIKKDSIIILITHDKDLLSIADRIICLDEPSIIKAS